MVVIPNKSRTTSPVLPRGLASANRAHLRQALAEEAFLKPNQIAQHRLRVAVNSAKEKVCIDWLHGDIMVEPRDGQGSAQCSLPKGYFADFVEKVVQLAFQQLAPHYEEEENVFVKRIAENTRSFMREDDAYHERLVPGARPSRIVNPQCIEEELYLYEPLHYWDDEQQKVMRDIIQQRMSQIGKMSGGIRKKATSRESSASPKHGKRRSSKRLSTKSSVEMENSDEERELEAQMARQRLIEARKSRVQMEMMKQAHEREKTGQMETELEDLEKEKENLRRQIEDAKAALAASESTRSRMQKESKAAAEKVEKLQEEVKLAQARAGPMGAGQMQADQVHAGQMNAQGVYADQMQAGHLGAEHDVTGQSGQPVANASSKSQSLAGSAAHGGETSQNQARGFSQAGKEGSQPDDLAGQIAQARAAEEARAAKERARLKARISELLKLIGQMDPSQTNSLAGGYKQRRGDSDEVDSDAAGHASLTKNAARSGMSGKNFRGSKGEADSDDDSMGDTDPHTSTTRDDTLRTLDRSMNASRKTMLEPPQVRGFFQRQHDEATNRMMRTAVLREDHLIAQEGKFANTVDESMTSKDPSKKGATGQRAKVKESKPSAQLVSAFASLGKRRNKQERRNGQSLPSPARLEESLAKPAESPAKRAESCPQRRSLAGGPPAGKDESTASATSRSTATPAPSRPISRGAVGGNSKSSPSISRPVSRGTLAGEPREKMAGSPPGNMTGNSKDTAAPSRPVSRGTAGDLGDTVTGKPSCNAGGHSRASMAMSNSRGSLAASSPLSRGTAGNLGGGPHVGAGDQARASAGAIATSNPRESASASRPVSRGTASNLGDTLAGGSHAGQARASAAAIATSNPRESLAASRPLSRGTAGNLRDIPAGGPDVSAGGQTEASTGAIATSNSRQSVVSPLSRGRAGNSAAGMTGDPLANAGVLQRVNAGAACQSRASTAASRRSSKSAPGHPGDSLAGESRDSLAGESQGSKCSSREREGTVLLSRSATGTLAAAVVGNSRASTATSRPYSSGSVGHFGDHLDPGAAVAVDLGQDTLTSDSAASAGDAAGAMATDDSRASASPSRSVSRGGLLSASKPVRRVSTIINLGGEPTNLGGEPASDSFSKEGNAAPTWPVSKRRASKGKPAPSPAASVESPMVSVDESNWGLSAGSSMFLNPPDLSDSLMVQEVARSLGDARAAGRFPRDSDTAMKAVGTGSASPDKMQHSGSGETLGPPDHWGWSVLYTTKGPTGKL